VVAKKASSPGEVDRSNFMLRASSIVQMKKGVQHTRKHTEQVTQNKVKLLFFLPDLFLLIKKSNGNFCNKLSCYKNLYRKRVEARGIIL
jgi:hypothetical protein